MAKNIHHVERIKFAIALYVSRADKVGLVNIVEIKCIVEIRVLDAFGDIASFF